MTANDHDVAVVMPASNTGILGRITIGRIGLGSMIAALLMAAPGAQAETWEIQRGPSHVSFSVKHMFFRQVNGEFKNFSGTVECPGQDFGQGKIDVTIEVGSIYTGHLDRDEHLRKEDFFFEERFPHLRYVSRAVEHLGGSSYEITGDLTVRGVTLEVRLNAELTNRRRTPRGDQVDFRATGTLNRYDFGLRWNEAVELGQVLVGEEVELTLDVALLAIK